MSAAALVIRRRKRFRNVPGRWSEEMIRMMCITGAVTLLAALPAGGQGSSQSIAQSGDALVDSTAAKPQRSLPHPPRPSAPLPACRAGAYSDPYAGPGLLYVIGDLLVGGDSTVPGYVARVPVYLKSEDADRVDVIKGPAAVALYGCRARQGVVRIELKPEVKLRPEWRAIVRVSPPQSVDTTAIAPAAVTKAVPEAAPKAASSRAVTSKAQPPAQQP